ncbi:hypothetical protein [Scrofimicrobium sp. R131]|uniref:SdpI family protein n=1 Tax=Scrofimicrobium appendicitidis TaxID=3079930 RepID=A0AAU7V6C9_9ACTO
MFWGLLATALFAWFAGLFGVWAWRAKDGQIPFGSPVGLRGDAVRANEQKWDRAHRAAAPFVGTAAVICLLQAGGSAWSALIRDTTYLVLQLGTALVLIALLLVLAQRSATR